MATTRLLATSLFADIVGYTDLMQRDEVSALKKLDLFKSCLEREIPEHGGEIIQYFGDGCLAIFGSALEAVSCARKLQQQWGQAVDLPVRIGLHLGDVIRKDDNVYGDSVNIASRIESMGIPNSILVSESVRNNIKNQPGLQFQSLGEYEFKNVSEPMAVYALDCDQLKIPDPASITGKLATKDQKRRAGWQRILVPVLAALAILLIGYNVLKPDAEPPEEIESSIAVLPFTNLSRDADQDYLTAGFTSEINHQLSKIESLSVISQTITRQMVVQQKTTPQIAKELDVNYILEGTINKAGERIRLITNLTRMTDNQLIWSEEFDLDEVNLIDAQIQVSTGIAEKLPLNISQKNINQLKKIPTSSPLAYEFYLRALHSSPEFVAPLESFKSTIRLLEKAISLDENFAQAYALMARVNYNASTVAGADAEELRQKSMYFANTAISLDSLLPDPYVVIGLNNNDKISGSGVKWFAKANKLDQKAGLVELSLHHIALGEYITAFEYAQLKVQRDPKSPDGYANIAHIHQDLGNHERTIELLENLIDEGFTSSRVTTILFFSFLSEGKTDEAIALVEKLVLPIDSITGIGRKGMALFFGRKWREAEDYYLRTNNKDMDLALMHLKTGRNKSAERLFQESIQRRQIIKAQSPWFLRDLSRIYAAKGEIKKAYAYLDTLDQRNALHYPFLEVDPFYDLIRNENRFQEYCDKLEAKKEQLRRQIQNMEKELNLEI